MTWICFNTCFDLFQHIIAVKAQAYRVELSCFFAHTWRVCAVRVERVLRDDVNSTAGRMLPHMLAIFSSSGVESCDTVLTGSGTGEKFVFMDINRTLNS